MFRLERMELIGFKSFCDRTEVVFPDGITVVVGPNGCGKSNLGDALSWVLGEQSARAVRGEKMEDLIFGGTEGRRALGMAEVTLVLARLGGGNGHGPGGGLGAGNGRGSGEGAGEGLGAGDPAGAADGGNGSVEAHFEPAFREDGRLVVGRRVFRSGESEYFMNGRRCRLRDIHDVLYGTGLGTRAYSVIEQGKVDTILSGKPRERRLLIEEAAGVLGYKVRKRAALLKLEATQANLLRIQDLVSEVERQIGALKRQAARARRFRRLQEEARRRSRSLFALRLAEVERVRGESEEALRSLDAQEAALSAALGRAAAAAGVRERRREELRAELRAADESLAALERRHDQHAASVAQLRDQQGEAAAQAERLRVEAARLRQEAARVAAEGETSGREGSALAEEAGRTAAEAASAESEFRAALAGLEEGSARVESDRRSLFETLDRLTQMKSAGASIDENRRSGRARLERLGLEAAQVRRESEEAAQAAQALLGRRGELQVDAARAREEARAAAAERSAREREREGCLHERAAIAGRLEGLEEFRRRLARLEAEEHGGDDAEPAARVADFVEAAPEIEAAVEAYAQDWLAGQAIPPGEVATALARLRTNGPRFWIPRPAGPAPAALPADPRILGRLGERVRPHGPHAEAIRARLMGAALVRDGGEAMSLAGELPGIDLVALDGTVVTAAGDVFRRQRGAPEMGLLGRRRLARQSDEERNGLRRSLEEIEARAAALAQDAEQQGERERASAQRAADWGSELASLSAREGEAAVSRQRLAGRLRLIEEEAAALSEELGRWEREAERLGEEISVAEEARRSLEGAAAAAQVEAERRREALSALHARLDQSRARQAQAERERAVRLQAAEALERRSGELAQRAEQTDDEARQALERGARLGEGIADAEARLKAALEERARALEGRSRLEREDEDLRAALETGHEEQRRLQHDLDAVREGARDRQVALAKVHSDLGHLEHECRQELDLGLEQVRPAEGETLPDRDACERDLVELRDSLARLGPVNLLALEEYQELEKRHQFLDGQHKDLQDSVESLRNTIQRLNRRSREQFLHAFEQIRTHFHELFRLLFGGGRAELRLEEGEDVLECGMEVNVQPPGKRLQSITLLSGGEKAMSALALLFAIFRYKPSPFCLLDEVDAALDESNVERFLRIVREFQQQTQFVLITHNKRSMEIGDHLYGVTMEEPGISKLVSVDLS